MAARAKKRAAYGLLALVAVKVASSAPSPSVRPHANVTPSPRESRRAPLASYAAALGAAVAPRPSPPPKPTRAPSPAASVATTPAPRKPAARAFEKRGARAPQGGFGARRKVSHLIKAS